MIIIIFTIINEAYVFRAMTKHYMLCNFANVNVKRDSSFQCWTVTANTPSANGEFVFVSNKYEKRKQKSTMPSVPFLFQSFFFIFTCKFYMYRFIDCLRMTSGSDANLIRPLQLKILLLVFLTFACPHTSLVPSLSACLAAGFVPSMHCLLDHFPMHTM